MREVMERWTRADRVRDVVDLLFFIFPLEALWCRLHAKCQK
jgi:hypothetical protein